MHGWLHKSGGRLHVFLSRIKHANLCKGPLCTLNDDKLPRRHAASGQMLAAWGSAVPLSSGEHPGDHNHQEFPKSTAIQMGDVLQHKWEAYCATNGRSNDSISLSSERGGTESTAIQIGDALQLGTEKVPQRNCVTKTLPNVRVNFLVRFASKPLFYWVMTGNPLELFRKFFGAVRALFGFVGPFWPPMQYKLKRFLRSSGGWGF